MLVLYNTAGTHRTTKPSINHQPTHPTTKPAVINNPNPTIDGGGDGDGLYCCIYLPGAPLCRTTSRRNCPTRASSVATTRRAGRGKGERARRGCLASSYGAGASAAAYAAGVPFDLCAQQYQVWRFGVQFSSGGRQPVSLGVLVLLRLVQVRRRSDSFIHSRVNNKREGRKDGWMGGREFC